MASIGAATDGLSRRFSGRRLVMTRTLLILALALSAGSAAAQEFHNDPGADDARLQIERQGYRDVRGLAEDGQGVWHGRALRGNTEVQLLVDHDGTVSVNR
jgi:hypothetical protein